MDLARDGKIKYCNIDSLDSEHEFKTLINLKAYYFRSTRLSDCLSKYKNEPWYVLMLRLELAVDVSFKLT